MKPRAKRTPQAPRPLTSTELTRVIGGAPDVALKQHVDNPGQTP